MNFLADFIAQYNQNCVFKRLEKIMLKVKFTSVQFVTVLTTSLITSNIVFSQVDFNALIKRTSTIAGDW